MLNHQPIFVNGTSRGGTNILMNLLLSSPDTAMPSGELNRVFAGGGASDSPLKIIIKKWFYQKPLKIVLGSDIFDRVSYQKRPHLASFPAKYIDLILWMEKQAAVHPTHNKWKTDDVLYTSKERREARLVAKSHDALVLNNDGFRAMYPDARFVGIIRNGFAVCESLMRRKWSLESAARHYQIVGSAILDEAQKMDYLLVRFEDILASPLSTIETIYRHCHLDLDAVKLFRLQHKNVAVAGRNQSELLGQHDRQMIWYTQDELGEHFKPSVNENQISRLTPKHKDFIRERIGSVMSQLGYSIE
jgi:hypothetical protein